MALFRRRGHRGVVNARPVTVETFTPDPRGAALFAGATRAAARPLTRTRAIVPQGGAQFGGTAPAPQAYKGLARLGARSGLLIYDKSAQLGSGEKSTALSSPSLRVFAARSARGKS